MKNYIAITVTFLCIVSCSGVPAVRHELTRAESLMESRPDSALAILEGINTSDLVRKKDKAAFALSMSMALDKNYIDTTDFSILQPAIDYTSAGMLSFRHFMFIFAKSNIKNIHLWEK